VTVAAGRGSRVVTPERFASGMTFDQYMTFIGTPENLAREAGWWRGPERMDWSGTLRAWYDGLRLRDDQVAAIRWLTAQPKGPAKVLVIPEDGTAGPINRSRSWSSTPRISSTCITTRSSRRSTRRLSALYERHLARLAESHR
jgi:hypothetical protein